MRNIVGSHYAKKAEFSTLYKIILISCTKMMMNNGFY